MADSTGPVLALTGISFMNHWIGNNQGIDLKILLAGGVAAGGLSLLENVSRPLAVGIAWIAFVTTLLAPLNGRSPVQNATRLTGL